MPAHALFDALKDFGSRPIAGPPGRADERREAAAAAPDIGAIVAAEVAKAEAALAERLGRSHEAALEAERQRHAAEVEVLLGKLGEEAGRAIAERFNEMEAGIGSHAAATAARILGSFLSEELQARSVAALAASIREAAADRETVRIEVRGPQSLFESLRAALGERAGNLNYVEAPGFDLVIAIDGNLFETRLAEWSAVLSEILS